MPCVYMVRTQVAARVAIPRLKSITLDLSTLLFTLAIALAAGLAAGFAPALATAGSDLTDALKDGPRTGGSARGNRMRSVFVVAEIALALVLRAGAGLLVRSFARLLNASPGFTPDHVVTMRLNLPGSAYADDEGRLHLSQAPRTAAGAAGRSARRRDQLPADGRARSRDEIRRGGTAGTPLGQEPVCDMRVIAGDYFAVMRIPLIRGRSFHNPEFTRLSTSVVVSETMARETWPGEDPIGKRIIVSWNGRAPSEVVGVVGDVRHAGLDAVPRPINQAASQDGLPGTHAHPAYRTAIPPRSPRRPWPPFVSSILSWRQPTSGRSTTSWRLPWRSAGW